MQNCTILGEIMNKMAGEAGDENETIDKDNSGTFFNRPSRRNGVQHKADLPVSSRYHVLYLINFIVTRL